MGRQDCLWDRRRNVRCKPRFYSLILRKDCTSDHLDTSGSSQAIILAAPYHQTGIHFVNSLAPALIPKQPYVKLYVTFIITK